MPTNPLFRSTPRKCACLYKPNQLYTVSAFNVSWCLTVTLINMRLLLCVPLAVLALAAVCSADCHFRELVLTDIKNPPKGCHGEDGVMHDFGSNWVKDCYECYCSNSGISCCSKMPATMDVPSECEVIVDRKECTAKMVMKSDKTKACEAV
ncbi:hypothetical protein AAFF_G00139180 [Aldrovandia affinis]|uniref:Beta-microseminoprotein n=1 Tax=Aldrovandia affinis TaxID=143900 RepID=A0AAD7TC42_9TELE|nr:hypothetical protein AAFF_G00139180 [Aldrovandia affinis]